MGDHKDDGINIDPAYVRALAELLDDTSLTEIEVEDGDRKVRVSRGGVAMAAPAPVATPAIAPQADPVATPSPLAAPRPVVVADAREVMANPEIDTVVWEFPLRTLLAHRVSGQRQLNHTQHF